LWASDCANSKFEGALVWVIQARSQGAVAADERVLLHFQDGCPASLLSFLRWQAVFKAAVLALWASDHANSKFKRALVWVIQARSQGAVAADERVPLHFQDGCPALVASILTLEGPLPRRRSRLVGHADTPSFVWHNGNHGRLRDAVICCTRSIVHVVRIRRRVRAPL